jgi:hypothetical protein
MTYGAFVVLVALLGSTTAAYAYIDPGTGSFVLQMVLATALAAGTAVKIFWLRIKDVIRRIIPSSSRGPGHSG